MASFGMEASIFGHEWLEGHGHGMRHGMAWLG